MNVRDVLSILHRAMPVFLEGLTATEVETIVAKATIRRVTANTEITNEAYPANRLVLLLQGVARGYLLSPRGDRAGLDWFPAGTTIGVSALVPRRSHYLVSFEATKTSWALVWDQLTIQSLAATYPRLMQNALAVVYDFFDLYRILYLSVCCDSGEKRLANVLGHLATRMGRRVADDFELDISNEELAQLSNVKAKTVTKLTRQWRQQGWITKSRGRLVVHQPDQLLRAASGSHWRESR